MARHSRMAFACLVVPAIVCAGCFSPLSSPSASASNVKIGVVTSVGRIDDNGFNQLSYEGAKQAAQQIGATVEYFVPKDASDYAQGIQDFLDQGYAIIVTTGVALGADATRAARANPGVWFVAVDVAPCVDEAGDYDSTGACKGDAATLLPRLVGLRFQEDQLGYLAGIVAAAVSKTGVIGQIGAISSSPSVVRYLQGFEMGARSYNPHIRVETAFFSVGDLDKAYDDPAWGKTFGSEFIAQNGVDVIFPVARDTGQGALDAACEAGILAIGVDVDQYLSSPAAQSCIVASAEKNLSKAVSDTILAIDAGTAKGGVSLFGAANGGIGISPFHLTDVTVPADVQEKLDSALAGMKDGTLKTCPDQCGVWTQ
jgi:basic membrane protein A